MGTIHLLIISTITYDTTTHNLAFHLARLTSPYRFADHASRAPLSATCDTKSNTHSFLLFEQESCSTLSGRNAASALRRRRATSEKLPNSSLKPGPSSGKRWCRSTILRANTPQDSHSSCRQFNCVWRRPSGCFSDSQTFHIQCQSVARRSAVQNYFQIGSGVVGQPQIVQRNS